MTLEARPTALHLRVMTCESILYEGEVAWVELPLADGLIGIWPGHAPLVGELGSGTLRYAVGGAVDEVAVGGGTLHVSADECAVLISAAPDEPGAQDGGDRLYAVLEAAVLDLWRDERRVDLFGEQLGDDELDTVAADGTGD
ncbi:MAG: F0F1 ATP synthase subunit epsilon [Chloroflexi bacterium]|nr:F0F1 ATP synthase subunit epsilon [Chloroflexota bacterium]